MITGIIVARQLGPDLRGQYGLIIYAASLVGLGHLGLAPAITYYTGKKELDRSKIVTFVIASSLSLGIVLSVLFYLVYPYIPGIWTEISHLVMIVGLVSVPFTFLLNFFNAYLMGLLRVRQHNIVNILRGLFYLILIVVLVLMLKGKVFLTTVSYTASIIVASLLGLFIFTRDVRPAARIEPSFTVPFLHYGFRAYLVIVFTFLNYRLDIFLVKYFLTNSDVAFYQIAVNVAERLWYIPNALNHVLLPTLLTMNRGSAEFTAKVCRNSLLVMSCLSVFLVFTGRFFLVLLYGKEYLPAAFALYSILWGITITTLFKVLSADFAARKRLGIVAVASFIGIVVNIAANLYMIPRYGIVGAGVSTSLSYTVLTVILIIAFLRYRKMRLREILIPTGEDFASYREFIKRTLGRFRGAGSDGR